MDDLSPRSFDLLADRILANETLAVRYQNMRSNGGPEGHITSCDEQCRKQLYCSIRHAIYEDARVCSGWKAFDLWHKPGHVITEKLYGPWYTQEKQELFF